MTARILEAVPNFSEGRNLAVLEAIVEAVRSAGAEVIDWSADPDHHRSVVTLIGPPRVVEQAAVAAAKVAVERIDLRGHRGVHPRIGAIDVLPFVPLVGLSLDDARASARRVGQRLADEIGIPVYYYGHASDPPGRSLAALRRGGFETLADAWPAERVPDVLPSDWGHPGAHPSAGACCVGARKILLAWNVWLRGIPLSAASEIARVIRETDGGFPGLRALALELQSRRAVQISMNLEDVDATSPAAVFRRIQELVEARGGEIVQTEIIGMMPDQLALSSSIASMKLDPAASDRLLSRQLVRYLSTQREKD